MEKRNTIISPTPIKSETAVEESFLGKSEIPDSASTYPELMDNFSRQIDQLLLTAKTGLSHYYRTDKIKIEIISSSRTMAQQRKLFEAGKTKTVISLHNYGGAVDISIRIEGKHQSGTTQKTLIPYQIVGHYAQQAGLFWGRDQDAGHIAMTEHPYQLIQCYPELKHHPITREVISYLSKQPTIEFRYRPFFDACGVSYTGTYLPDKHPARGYLSPIDPSPVKKKR